MATFTPDDLRSATSVRFNPKDLQGATPEASVADSTATSTPMPADARTRALADFKSGKLNMMSPEAVKAHPQSAIQDGMNPLFNQGGYDEFTSGNGISGNGATAYGMRTNLKDAPGTSFLGTAGQTLNPFAWIAPPMAEALAPTNDNSAAPTFGHPDQARMGSKEYMPTANNRLARMAHAMGSRGIGDMYDTAYDRGQKGQNTNDLLGVPAGIAAGAVLPHALGKVAEHVLPKDIAMEKASSITRSALGSGPDSNAHGATPDVSAGQLKPPSGNPVLDWMVNKAGLGGTFRSSGRYLKTITDTKNAVLDWVGDRLKVSPNANTQVNPMDALKPVLDDATDHAGGKTENIENFRADLSKQINKVSNGTGTLNLPELHEFRKWIDKFGPNFEEDPSSKNILQNARNAIREQINQHAPEVTEANHHVQSLIQAEEDLSRKINTPKPEGDTFWSTVKNMFEPWVPLTTSRTGLSSLLREYAGQGPKGMEGILPSAPAGPPGPPPAPPATAATAGPPSPSGPSSPFPPPKLLGPAPFTATAGTPPDLNPQGPFSLFPQSPTGPGSVLPPGGDLSGMKAGVPEQPRVAGGAPASQSGAPTPIDPYRQAELASQDYLSSLRANRGSSGGPPPMQGPPAPPPETPGTPGGSAPAPTEPPPTAPAAPASPMANTAAPTNVKVGSQVGGFDEQGNPTSGKLEHVYQVGPEWFGDVADVRKGRTVRVKADTLYDRLAGPPETRKASTPGVAEGALEKDQILSSKQKKKAAKTPGTEPAGIAGGPPVGPDDPIPGGGRQPIQYKDITTEAQRKADPDTKTLRLTDGTLSAHVVHDPAYKTLFVSNIGDTMDVRHGITATKASPPGNGLNLLSEILDYAKRNKLGIQGMVINDRLGKLLQKLYPDSVVHEDHPGADYQFSATHEQLMNRGK